MKICFTGNVFSFGPDMAYGGERILYYLAKGLADAGHEVHVFAREGCDLSDTNVMSYTPVGPLQGDRDVHFEAVAKFIKDTGIKFDVYQCNYFGDGWNPSILNEFNYCELTWCVWTHMGHQLRMKPYNTLSYSKVMHQDFLDIGMDTSIIYYGIPKDLYSFSPDHDEYAVWIGKIEGGKEPHLAIKLAKAAGLKIVIMGPPYNTGCFWDQVAPYIDNETVFWVRGVDDAMKQKIMSRAKVFISSNGNTWKEHFGIVNAESLAMGTPILAFNRIGQECAIKVDNIIEDGKQGFFLNYNDSNDVEEILDKGLPLLNKIATIDRMECRKQFERRFTSDIMVSRYERFYEAIQGGERIYSMDLT